ncbi:hypothetical protein [Rariglobus hedericola]|uniref:Verru_Chthon cassette protein B n=1 Tax=Rariglobus hedericola TaxID=2597822 RepID=A0A556QMI2_9BACT|nr:hypothetical protein [Rariglobus hedericola]TSJ77860.1 hypothetical protein FPL22_00705 [Rariglobus hedericola]
MTFNSSKSALDPTARHIKYSAFSLVEVVVAVGIFALAIVGVIGLLAPTSKSIADVADSDAASRVITVIQSQLQQAGFTTVKASLGGTLFYASKDGSKVGLGSNPTLWTSNQEKFFEFTLVRNDTLSPAASDDAAGFLAFTVVLKWPAYVSSADGQGTAVVDNQKSVMVVPAAITR